MGGGKAKPRSKITQIIERRVPMMCVYMYQQRANIPLQAQTDMDQQWEPFQDPTTKLELSIGAISQSWIYMVGKKLLGKVDQLTLASGGSEDAQLFSVAINWSNKMNFSLYANMSKLLRQSHNYILLIQYSKLLQVYLKHQFALK